MTVIFIRSSGLAAGGGDVTPSTLNWNDITNDSPSTGYVSNSASVQTVAGIDSPIELKAAWTSTSSHPAKGQWIKNGVAVQSLALTPVSVTAVAGDKLYFAMAVNYTYPSGNYDTGTVTVTNTTDGAASIDTFAFVAQYVYSGGGGGGGGIGGPSDPNDPTNNNPPGGGQASG